MKKTSWWAGALLAASGTFLSQGRAAAQSCEADADCGAGYTCKTESYESCYSDWECDDNSECQPGEVICETYTSSWCANVNCEADADCPSFMACQPQTAWVCEGGGMGGVGGVGGGVAGTGAAGVGGAPIVDGGFEEPPTCEEVPAPSVCIPRYDLPCEAASDCGGGFDCVETYYWSCGGGGTGMGGFGGVGGGPAPTDAGSDEEGETDGGGSWECEQVPSGSNACQLQDLPCETNADCPAGLSCLEQYIYGECTGGAGTGGGGTSGTGGAAGMHAGTGGFAIVDGGSDPIECPEPEIVHKCMPPSHGGGGGSAGMGGAGTGGGEVDAGVEEPGGEAGAAGTSAAGAGGGGGADEDDDSEEGHGHGRGRGWLKRLLGCSTSGPVSSDGGAGWLLLGVAALVLRRRSITR